MMNVVKEAEIIAAGLAAEIPNLDVAWNTLLRGYVSLVNNIIEITTPITIGYLLGSAGSVYYFDYEGVYYYIGSKLDRRSPYIGTIWDEPVNTIALFEGTWDALAFVGPTAPEGIRSLVWDGKAVVGLNKADVDAYLTSYDQKWFGPVLTVAPPLISMEVTGFFFSAL